MAGTSAVSVRSVDVLEKLASFGQDCPDLPRISHRERMAHFCKLVAEIANSYASIGETIYGRDSSVNKTSGFDPLGLAVAHHLGGDIEETCWLLFLQSYFGSHPRQQWGLLEKIYLGHENGWKWERASADAAAFASWLVEHQRGLSGHGNMGGPHKYVSFDSHMAVKSASEIQAYICWIKSAGGHRQLFSAAVSSLDGSPWRIFDSIYIVMNRQLRCKKAITFDYLSLLGILGVLGIEPASPYISDHLLSKLGANWLFSGNAGQKYRANELEPIVKALALHLKLPFCIPVLHHAFAQVSAGIRAEDIQRFRWRHNR